VFEELGGDVTVKNVGHDIDATTITKPINHIRSESFRVSSSVSSQTHLHHWPRPHQSRGQRRIQGMPRGRPGKRKQQKAHLQPQGKDKRTQEQIS
jgi:hypothetical protein